MSFSPTERPEKPCGVRSPLNLSCRARLSSIRQRSCVYMRDDIVPRRFEQRASRLFRHGKVEAVEVLGCQGPSSPPQYACLEASSQCKLGGSLDRFCLFSPKSSRPDARKSGRDEDPTDNP